MLFLGKTNECVTINFKYNISFPNWMNAISKVCSWHWDTVFMVCKMRVGKSWKVASLSPQLQNPVKKKLQTDEEGVPEDGGSGQASQLSETHCNLMEVWSNVILDICPKYQRVFVTFPKICS